MENPSCIFPPVSEDFANKVVGRLSKEQLDKYHITTDKRKANAVKAIADLVESYVGKEEDFSKREEMLNNVDGFISDLDNFFSVSKVSDADFDEAQRQYDTFNKYNEEYGLNAGRIDTFEFDKDEQGNAEKLETFLAGLDKVVSYRKQYYKDGGIQHISFILMQPQKSDDKTPQQKAIDTINNIKAIDSKWLSFEITDGKGHYSFKSRNKDIPEGWQKTGRSKYSYDGKTIITETVTPYDPDADYPLISAPIGTHVDTVGRLVFDKGGELYEDGKLVNDEKLKDVIDSKLGGIFTIQGLKNLIDDFQRLEKQFKEKWGDDIWIYSGDIKLFGRKNDSDTWNIGKPDLLVVDGKGIVHVIDFKTYKMTDLKGYQTFNKGKAEQYGKQETSYIQILKSYGLNTDDGSYIVQIDTWYDSSDHGYEANRDYKGKLKEDRRDIYYNDSGYLGLIDYEGNGELSLGEYAEQEGNPTRQEVLDSNSDREILYMEPRLHIDYKEGKGFSDELAALRGKADIPFYGNEISYEQQWEALPQEDKANMKWLFGKPAQVRTAQGIVTLSSNDIESKPELIGSQEITDVANLLMYRVSNTVTALINGESYNDIPLSQPNTTDSTPLKGRRRSEVIRLVGIDNLINHAFSTIEDRYRENFPSEEDYRNGNYDDFDYEFEDDRDYQAQKAMSEKAKWLIDHKEQLVMAGTAKLMALENCVVPVKPKSMKFNNKTPDVRLSASDLEVADDTGDNESNQTFADLYLEGITDVEAWMIGQRNYSPKASLAQEVRRMYEDFYLTDNNGNVIKDNYGWGFSLTVDPTTAIQTTYDAVRDCETIDEMMDKLNKLAKTPNNNWVNQLISKISAKGNENLKKKFFRHFRKDTLNYSISEVKFDKKTGKRTVQTRIINMKSAYQTIMQSLGASFAAGKVGSYNIHGVILPIVKRSIDTGKNELTRIGTANNSETVASYIHRDINKWQHRIERLYHDTKIRNYGKTKEEKLDYIAQKIQEPLFNGKSIVDGVTEILQGIGVMVTRDVVITTCLDRLSGEKSNNASTLLRKADLALHLLNTADKKKGIPDGLAGNSAFPAYADSRNGILTLIANHVQEHVEASVYQDGKTYYSFTNPSRLGHIIRNLQDALNNEDKFEKYIQDNFGRYTGWYKSVDGEEWLCDWVDQFVNDSDARQALMHKCELSYIGTKYRDLGALGFQLSILHNYFGSRTDQVEGKRKGGYGWFALPTMSNKPVNEFVRMMLYRDSDEIVDRVLVKTFRQEMNRIADVLYHYTHNSIATDKMDITDKSLQKAKWSKEDIEGLKERINSHSITVDDLVRLSAITSGAKFHFLWYMNSEIKNNPELAQRIVERLNLLLTPENDGKASNLDSSREADTNKMIRNAIVSNMENIVDNELQRMRDIGLFDKETKVINGKKVQVLKYQDEFGGLLGSTEYDNHPNARIVDGKKESEREMESELKKFIWQDIAANINIIEITGGDLAYYGNAVNYQKRIAQEHSPGLHVMHDEKYDDGYFRSVHISDEKMRNEIGMNTEVALEDYLDKNKDSMSPSQQEDYKRMIQVIIQELKKALVTDGQSYSSPSSVRKKLALQGEWDSDKEKAYNSIKNGDFNINNLGIMLQPSKPFVTSDMAKYSGSTTMELRRVPLQDKNSEYLIVLAEALARGAGKRSKLVAICDFMERTAKFGDGRQGIDTVHFDSVNKVGKSGIIDIAAFDAQYKGSDEDYNKALTEYMLSKIRRTTDDESTQEQFDAEERLVKQGKLKREEVLYNSQYVDTIPVDDYIIQQEVPAHLLEHEQLYGSQIRILGISDITPNTEFDVNGQKMSDKELVQEYKELHAKNIQESYDDLMKELGLDGIEEVTGKDGDADFQSIIDLPVDNPKRIEVLQNLAFLLQKELSKDAKYGLDTRRACSLRYDSDGNPVNFNVPLMDPIQSKRIQMLLNSIIKKSINKQKINGGPVVQTTAYDQNLHIRFKDKNGNILKTFDEYGKTVEEYKKYLKDNQAGIAYFECYLPVPNATLERLMTNEDGSMMSMEQLQKTMPKDVWESMSKVIGYRIPTEDKYSMLPLKIMGFMPKAAGQVIMMPQEITYLTGSDFDIDKMYIMMKAFDTSFGSAKDMEKSVLDKYLNNHSTFRGIKEVARQVITNGNDIINGKEGITWLHGVTRDASFNKAKDFADWYKKYLISDLFTEYTIQDSPNRRDARKARDNRLLDLQWAVLTNEDTASKMLNPGNFDTEKKVGRVIRVHKSGALDPETNKPWEESKLYGMSIDELDNILEGSDPHNTTLPSSKIYFQHQNMQGSALTGLFANQVISHAFCSFQHIGIDLYDYNNKSDHTMYLDGHQIGDPDNPTVLDGLKGFNGQLISKTLASFLAASVDTAKDPVHSDLNISTFTGSVAATLARLGFDIEFIGYFLAQPVIMELSELYSKNSMDSFYFGDAAIDELKNLLKIKYEEFSNTDDVGNSSTLTKENLWKYLNYDDRYKDDKDAFSFQVSVLKAFNVIHDMAKNISDLTFCTKFNSISNAGGPTIADTMKDLDKVNKFFADVIKGKTCFYIPSTDKEVFTNPINVISSDPILDAFFSTTIAPDGASEAIFRNFFPHYFNGFQNVRRTFQENFVGNKKLSSKLYNQLLDDYLYYLMTYQDENHAPTLPSSNEAKKRLIGGLVKDFQAVSKISGRKPNMLLDQTLGGNCLRVRNADEFLAQDTLLFSASGLNSDGQQQIKSAWSDLITMNDPNLSDDDNERIRRLGVDLFFYTLMRNGFGFSPKTLMHLASVVVRYNATYANGFNNYIGGLSQLKNLDNFLMGNPVDSHTQIMGFLKQFIRNHSNNRQLVPNIDFQNSNIDYVNAEDVIDKKTGKKKKVIKSIDFGVPIDEEYKLANIMLTKGKPYNFITVTRKVGNQLFRELYELEEVAGGETFTEDGKTKVRYKKSSSLGLVNNFIEYNANDIPLEKSYFEDIRNESEDATDDETMPKEEEGDERSQVQESESFGLNDTWNNINHIIRNLRGPQAEKTSKGREYRQKLRQAFLSAERGSSLAKKFTSLLSKDADSAERQKTIDEINKQFQEQDKC